MNPDHADDVTRCAEALARAVAEQVAYDMAPAHRRVCGAAHIHQQRVEYCKKALTEALQKKGTKP